jgi:hypothetical protein
MGNVLNDDAMRCMNSRGIRLLPPGVLTGTWPLHTSLGSSAFAEVGVSHFPHLPAKRLDFLPLSWSLVLS